MNDFEDRVRRALRTDVRDVEAARLLRDVHRGATRRRHRRVAGGIAASVLVIAGAAGVATTIRGDERTLPEPLPATQTPSPSPTEPALPEGAAQGVTDVSVVSADRWFRLTVNVGCVACSTIWQNEQSAEGGWERLHDFEGTPADYGGPVDPSFGPVAYIAMAANGKDGWAWGSRLRSTHDGGRTWTVVTSGPGRGEGGSHELGVTDEFVWDLRRTNQSPATIWRSPLGSDDWTRVDPGGTGGVTGLFTVGSRVAVEVSDEGMANPRVRSSTDGSTWRELPNPCPGENEAYPSESAAFIVCFDSTGPSDRAVVYRSTDLTSWRAFGESTGNVLGVRPLADDTVLLVRPGRPAALMTPGGTMPVDLGLGKDEETFRFSCFGELCLLTTSDNRLRGSDDGGKTWHAVD